VRPWILRSIESLRPEPPPAVDSPEFAAALREVRWFSDHRTDEQLRIAEFWADGAGTVTPPGHWNEIAGDLIRANRMNELRAASVFAYLNMAMMDAGICCWDAKYAYWLLRPSQADPAITTPVGLPNFPSYTSGHASFSAAAAEVLGFVFPKRRYQLLSMAHEAAISRVYGGIHYRFDSEVGFEGGRMAAHAAIRRLKKSGWHR
jgi:membrane-associated phospholipid phosphatase